MSVLRVKASRFQIVLVILLGLFLIPLGIGLLISGLRGGIKVVPLTIGFLIVITFIAVFLLFFRGYRQTVKFFSDKGLIRNDGREFSWADLSRVVDKMAVKSATRKMLWRTEIQFRDGSSAWIIPSKVANYTEVATVLSGLGCERTQEDA